MATISVTQTPITPSTPVPLANAVAHVPANDVDVFSAPAAIYVGTTGNITVRPAGGGAAVTFTGAPAGQLLPVMVIGVNSTGLTAGALVAVS